MKKETFSIIFVPHDLKRTRTVRVPYPLLYVLFSLLAVGFVALIVFVATYGRLLVKAREASNLERQVAELTKRQESMSEITRNLHKIGAMGRQIRQMIGAEAEMGDSAGAALAARRDDEFDRMLDNQKEQILRTLPTFWPVRGYITQGFSIASPSYEVF